MKIKILAIGRNPEILQTVVRLVNNNPDWACTGASTDGDALTVFRADEFHLVLLGGGIEKESEQSLCATFRQVNPAIKIVQHYGGGSGLLSAEIYQALQ